jgi:hypothetical protein
MDRPTHVGPHLASTVASRRNVGHDAIAVVTQIVNCVDGDDLAITALLLFRAP